MANNNFLGAADLGFDPTRAWARVSLADKDDTSNAIEALLNPSSLKLSVKVTIGKLYPVGCSHATKQYGHTEEVTTQLEFILLASAVWRRNSQSMIPSTGKSVTQYVNWLSQFAYAKAKGYAPRIMLLVWPNVASMTFVMDSFDAEYTRFDRDLTVREAKVTMTIGEIRSEFKTGGMQLKDGWTGAVGSGTYSESGDPLNLGDHDAADSAK